MMPITSRLVMVAASIEQVLGNPVGVHGANYCEDTDKGSIFSAAKATKTAIRPPFAKSARVLTSSSSCALFKSPFR